MELFFKVCWILIFFCILFGIYRCIKKDYELFLGNLIIPVFLVIFYGLAAWQMPGVLQVEEMTFFIQQLQKFNLFAVFAVILFIMFVIILICDIRTIMRN